MVDYNKDLKIIYYESRELEIAEGNKYHFYFHNIYELAELIRTSPEAAKKLKELI